MTKMTSTQLKALCLSNIESCRKARIDWMEKFNKHPSIAMEWSDHLFLVAAREDLSNEVAQSLDGNATPESIEKYLTDLVLSSAQRVAASSSMGHNRMVQAQLQARAEILESLRGPQ